VRIIEVTVSPKGETTVQTKGYAGADCLEASKWLEQVLGVKLHFPRKPELPNLASAEISALALGMGRGSVQARKQADRCDLSHFGAGARQRGPTTYVMNFDTDCLERPCVQ
jgi:hypothetical protein